ncbi:MAG: DUF2298 domain-containing protein, partial [Chloroflexia bacterium]|nr:DUF2298 domain-containing protein [Chloroflexia bacterium]
MSVLDVTIRWYAVTIVATVAFLPWVTIFLRPFADRGAMLARPLALLGLIYPLWLLASISPIPFNTWGLWVTLVAAAAVGWPLVWRRGKLDHVVVRHLVLTEGVFLIAFGAYLWFHGYGPALTDQEKPSDLMMLSSTMRATEMPPRDAWLAGERVNYYYLGYVIFAALGRLVGAAPEVAFNLALATVFGMTVVAVLGVGANVVARWRPGRTAIVGGMVAGILVTAIGNPWAMVRFLQEPSAAFDSPVLGLLFFESIGWDATRFLFDTQDVYAITEFPIFSFILADLHPHLMALPYAIAALGVAWLLAVLPSVGWRRVGVVARVVAAGGLLGALYAMNSWDFPTYLAIAGLALLLGPNGRSMPERLRLLGLLVASALLLWAPFILRFEAPTVPGGAGAAATFGEVPVIGGVLASVAGYTGERTSAREYLGVFGFFYVVALVLIGTALWSRRARSADPMTTRAALVGGAILLLGALLIPAPLLLLCGLPLIAIVLLIDRDGRFSLANVALGLFAVAFALTLIPEFLYVLDIFGQRMNTIFKVYYQVWLLMALACALAIVALWTAPRRLPAARVVLSAATAVIIAGGLIYPVVAGYQWLEWRSPEREWT